MIRAVTLIPILLLSSAFALSGIGSGATSQFSCDGKPAHFHVHRVERIANKAFATDRFLDASPAKRSERKAWRAHKFCVVGEFRERAEARIDKARARFDEFFRSNYTPYHFGEPTIQDVAIPPDVVRCETNGSYGPSRWSAVNPSSHATGPYQMLPSTYAGVCGLCDWSHRDQHVAATRVWARSGGGEWACA